MGKGEILFTEGPLNKKILKFVLPLVMAYFIQQAYSSADLIIVGHYMGKNASAAIGASSLLITIAIGLFSGLAMGVSMLFARAYGAGDNERKKKIYHCSYRVAVALGIGVTVAGFIFSPYLLKLMQTPDDIFELTVIYFRIYFLGITFMAVFEMFASIIRAVGNSSVPMIFQTIAGGINVILDLILVNILDNGIVAVSVATVIAQGIGVVLISVYLAKNMRKIFSGDTNVVHKKSGKTNECEEINDKSVEAVVGELNNHDTSGDRTKKDEKGNDKTSVKDAPADNNREKSKEKYMTSDNIVSAIFALGMPVALQTMVMSISNMFLQANINTLGVDTITAYTAFFKIELFIYYPAVSVGQALLIASNQNIGAGKTERISLVIKTCLKIGLAMIIPLETLETIFAPYLVSIFNSEPGVIEVGTQIIRIIAPFYVVYLIYECMSNAVRAMGKTITATVVSITTFVGLRTFLYIIINVLNIQSVVNVSVIYISTWCLAVVLLMIIWNKLRKTAVGNDMA